MSEIKPEKLFLATSFSGKVDYGTGLVLPEFREEIEWTLDALRSVGRFSVFCAMEHEGWKISDDEPSVGVMADLDQIIQSDILVALVHDFVSAGVQYEMGYANALGLNVVVATKSDYSKLAYFNQGLVQLGDMNHVMYESPEDLTLQVKALTQN